MVKKSVYYNLAHAGHTIDELVWVDNGSTDGVRQVMQNIEPEITILHDTNMGVAKGYNAGMHAATQEYIVITGCDTLMPKNWLAIFIKHVETIKDTGVACIYCSPVEKVPERKRGDKLVHVNGLAIWPALPMGRRIISRQLLQDRIGYFREDFGLYGWEDIEWGERALKVCKQQHLQCYAIHGAVAEHLGTEGIITDPIDLKDDADYYRFKHKEALDPAKQEVMKKAAAQGYPYYNPFQ